MVHVFVLLRVSKTFKKPNVYLLKSFKVSKRQSKNRKKGELQNENQAFK